MSNKGSKNRRKGNVRPSSSGRSAELMSTSRSGFLGFGSAGTGDPTFALPSGIQVADPELRVILKQLAKKDPTTKLKGLQSLTISIRENKREYVEQVLLQWPKLFCKLAMDNDHRVREAAYVAQGEIATLVKKGLAPYMKSIISIWLVGTQDSYAQVSSAARVSFSRVFTEDKTVQVIEAYKMQLFEYFMDVIFNVTPATVPDSKDLSDEEKNNKYLRMLSSSFLALSYVISVVTANDACSKCLEQVEEMLKNEKFWKLAKHEDNLVKRNWYSFIKTVCDCLPESAEKHARKICNITFGCLSQEDILSQVIWEASLSITKNITNWWEYTKIKEVILPSLCKALELSKFGEVHPIYQSLKIVLENMPDTIHNDLVFYEKLFCSVRERLTSSFKHADDHRIVVKSFGECLLFIMLKNLGNFEESKVIREYLITDQLLSVILNSLLNENTIFVDEMLYTEIGNIHFSLFKLSENDTCEGNGCNEVLILFWEKFLESIRDIISTSKVSTFSTTFVRRLTFLFKTLHYYNLERVSKIPSIHQDVKVSLMKNSPLMLYSADLLCSIIKCLNVSQVVWLTDLLTSLLLVIPSDEIFTMVLKKCELSLPQLKSPAIYFCEQVLVDIIIKTYLAKVELKENLSENIVALCTACCFSVSPEEICLFLDNLTDIDDLLLRSSLKSLFKVKEHSGVKYWVENSRVLNSRLNHIAEELDSSQNLEAVWPIVQMFLTFACSSETTVESPKVDTLLDTIHKKLESISKTSVPSENDIQFVSLVCEMFADIVAKNNHVWKISWMEKFLLTFFLISLNEKDFNLPHLLSDCLVQLWSKGVIEIAQRKDSTSNVLQQMSSVIHDLINKTDSFEGNQHLINLASLFLTSFSAALHVDSIALLKPEILQLLELILPSVEDCNAICLQIDPKTLFLSSLQAPYHTLVWLSDSSVSSEVVLKKMLLITHFIREILDRLSYTQNNQKAVSSEEAQIALKSCSVMVKYVPYFLFAEALSRMLCSNGIEKSPQEVLFWKEESFKGVEMEIIRENFFEVFTAVVEKVKNEESIWTEVISYFVSCILQENMQSYFRSFYEISKDSPQLVHIEHCIFPLLDPQDQYSLLENKVSLLTANDLEEGKSILNFINKTLDTTSDWPDDRLKFYLSVFDWLKSASLPGAPDYMDDVEAKILENADNLNNLGMVFQFYRLIALRCPIVFSEHWNFILDSLSDSKELCKRFVTMPLHSSAIGRFAFNYFSFAGEVISLYKLESNSRERQEFPETFEEKFCILCNEIFQHILEDIYLKLSAVNDIFPFEEKLCKSNKLEDTVLEGVNSFLQKADSFEMIDVQKCFEELACREKVLESICQLFYSQSRLILEGAGFFLKKLLVHLAEEQRDNKQDIIPPALLSLIKDGGSYFSAMDVEEQFIFEPNRSSYHCALGYLCLWNNLLLFFAAATVPEARPQYAETIEESKILDQLLTSIFSIMPKNPAATMFSEPVNLEAKIPSTISLLQHVACNVYLNVLLILPALVRSWLKKQPPKLFNYIDKFTSSHVSQVISAKEIEAVRDANLKIQNMTIRGLPLAREVVASYTIEDKTLELVMNLPANHPLGSVSIETSKNVGVPPSQWNRWHRQLSQFLMFQNGSILEGILIWKRNLDKRFDGVEECMICFSVLHERLCQLPKMTCNTCRKKYHSACLYQWVTQGTNPSCPTCRAPF